MCELALFSKRTAFQEIDGSITATANCHLPAILIGKWKTGDDNDGPISDLHVSNEIINVL